MLTNTTLILTQNPNVQKHLRHCETNPSYVNIKDKCGKVWLRKDIKLINHWIDELSESLLTLPYYRDWKILSNCQELAIWHQIISSEQNFNNDYEILTEDSLLNIDTATLNMSECWKRERIYNILQTPYLKGLNKLSLGLDYWKKYISGDEISVFSLKNLNSGNIDSGLDARDSEDFKTFRKWQQTFQHICEEGHWIDRAVLMTLISAHLSELIEIVNIPKTIVLYSFLKYPKTLDELFDDIYNSPQLTILIKKLQEIGCKVVISDNINDKHIFPDAEKIEKCKFHCYLRNAQLPATNSKYWQDSFERPQSIYKNNIDEMYHIASKVKKLIVDQKKGDNKLSIGVIVPNLKKYRSSIVKAFDDVLFPQAILPEHNLDTRPYTLSIGVQYTESELVRSALSLFKLLGGEQRIADLLHLINSPYLFELPLCFNYCAKLDISLRDLHQQFISFEDILEVVNKDDTFKGEPTFLQEKFNKMADMLNSFNISDNHRYDEWAEFFRDILTAINWATLKSLDKIDIKVKKNFYRFIDDIEKLSDGIIDKSVDYDCALSQLTILATQNLYKPIKNSYKAQVHISDILESIGMRYDYIFILGLTDKTWPPTTPMLPYIPTELQKALRMPGTSEDDVYMCNWITDHIQNIAPEGTISFADNEVDGSNIKEINISSMVKYLDCDFERKSLVSSLPNWCDKIISSSFEDNQNIYLENTPLDPVIPPAQKIIGNEKTLQAQLDCPFKAMVSTRWIDRNWKNVNNSLAYIERSELLKTILSELWKKWKSSEKLYQLNDELLEQDIQTTVRQICTNLLNSKNKRSIYSELYQNKLVNIVKDWFKSIEPLRHDIANYKVQFNKMVKIDLNEFFTANMCVNRLDTWNDDGQKYCHLSKVTTSSEDKLLEGCYNRKNKQTGTTYITEDVVLPLYALCATDSNIDKYLGKLDGIGYDVISFKRQEQNSQDSSVSKYTLSYKSIVNSQEKTQIKKVPGKKSDNDGVYEDFEALINVWREQLEELSRRLYSGQDINICQDSDEICKGQHPAIPRDSEKVCKFCDYKTLCRRFNE